MGSESMVSKCIMQVPDFDLAEVKLDAAETVRRGGDALSGRNFLNNLISIVGHDCTLRTSDAAGSSIPTSR